MLYFERALAASLAIYFRRRSYISLGNDPASCENQSEGNKVGNVISFFHLSAFYPVANQRAWLTPATPKFVPVSPPLSSPVWLVGGVRLKLNKNSGKLSRYIIN